MNKVREWYSENARPYRPPRAVNADDTADIQEIDEIKLHELKEVNYRIFGVQKWIQNFSIVLLVIRSK